MKNWLTAKGFEPKTLLSWRCSRRVIVRLLGDKLLSEITPAEGDAFITRLKEDEGYRSRSIQIMVGHLRRSLQVAVDDKVLTELPKLTRIGVTDAKEHVFHTPAQTEQLLAELQRRLHHGHAEEESVLAIFMAVSLGMRKGEVLSRRWTDISWDGAGALVIAEREVNGRMWWPKRKRRRRVPLTPPLRAALQEAWLRAGRGDGWIFPQADNPSRARTDFKKGLANACAAAGLPVLHPHALRHTAATRWAWMGIDRATAMELGGWQTGEMLDEIYEHSNVARMADAMVLTAVGNAPATQKVPPSAEGGEGGSSKR